MLPALTGLSESVSMETLKLDSIIRGSVCSGSGAVAFGSIRQINMIKTNDQTSAKVIIDQFSCCDLCYMVNVWLMLWF